MPSITAAQSCQLLDGARRLVDERVDDAVCAYVCVVCGDGSGNAVMSDHDDGGTHGPTHPPTLQSYTPTTIPPLPVSPPPHHQATTHPPTHLEMVKMPPMTAKTEVRNWRKEGFWWVYSTMTG